MNKAQKYLLKNNLHDELLIESSSIEHRVYTSDLMQKYADEQLALCGVMPQFNSLIIRLVELISVKYPSRQISEEFVSNLRTLWKGKEHHLQAKINELEKELNLA